MPQHIPSYAPYKQNTLCSDNKSMLFWIFETNAIITTPNIQALYKLNFLFLVKNLTRRSCSNLLDCTIVNYHANNVDCKGHMIRTKFLRPCSRLYLMMCIQWYYMIVKIFFINLILSSSKTHVIFLCNCKRWKVTW